METRFRLNTKKVQHLMIDRDISAVEIARKARMHKSTISRHVHNRRRNPEVQRLIARALKVSLREIVINNGRKAA